MLVSPDTAARRRSKGKWLYAAAWGVEVLAALVGLGIAGASAYAAYDEIVASGGAMTRSGLINVVLGALPFLMVAVVELTKIPLAAVMFYSGDGRWRAVFGLALAALVVITFETALNGFERNFSTLTRVIENIKRDSHVIDKRVAQLDERMGALRSDPEQAVLARFVERERDLRGDRDRQIESLKADAIGLRNELANISKVQTLAIERDKLAGLAGSRKRLETQLAENSAEQRRISAAFAVQLRELDVEKQAMLGEARQREQEAGRVANERQALLERRTGLDEEVMHRIGENQVYRITQLWTGIEDASRIAKNDVRLTGLVWFGSIALIVAACGTLLAFASFVIADGPVRVMPNPVVRARSRQRVHHALRMLILAIRKRTTRRIEKIVTIEKVVEVVHEIPVERVVEREIVREVPVEKVVERDVVREVPVDRVVIQEVPREVVRREFIHVPLYTNDIELVRAAQAAGWPKPTMDTE